jgi:hypothetical protein
VVWEGGGKRRRKVEVGDKKKKTSVKSWKIRYKTLYVREYCLLVPERGSTLASCVECRVSAQVGNSGSGMEDTGRKLRYGRGTVPVFQ